MGVLAFLAIHLGISISIELKPPFGILWFVAALIGQATSTKMAYHGPPWPLEPQILTGASWRFQEAFDMP